MSQPAGRLGPDPWDAAAVWAAAGLLFALGMLALIKGLGG